MVFLKGHVVLKVQTELGTYHLSYSEYCACPKASLKAV